MNDEMTVPVLISLLCIALVTFAVSWFVRSSVTIVASVALGTGFTMEAYSYWQLGYVDPLMAVTFFPVTLVAVAVSALTLDFLRWIRRSRPGPPPRP
jgi:hypothetical protein